MGVAPDAADRPRPVRHLYPVQRLPCRFVHRFAVERGAPQRGNLRVGLLLIAVGIVRTRDTFVWSRPSAWLFVAGTVAALVAIACSLLFVGRLRSHVDGAVPSTMEHSA
jgi:protein-S-isoprenylcysteine O-methyltransferase Ste14